MTCLMEISQSSESTGYVRKLIRLGIFFVAGCFN